jgi:serine phosphatase RsbU (regulator of sigma subunit)
VRDAKEMMMQIAIAKRSYRNDPHCGDECVYWQSDGRIVLCVVDGLGHGQTAEVAAKAAVDYIARHFSEPLPTIFAGCSRAISHTRGVVMGIAAIDETEGTLTYAGVGNPRAMIVRAHRAASLGRDTFHLTSSSGIVGRHYRSLWPESISLNKGDLVILYTDGIPTRMHVMDYDDGLRKDVQRLAERILRDWGRDTDDAAVLVFRSEVA